MVYDLHTHTFLSDGVLSPSEMIRRATVAGYEAVALTDHVGAATIENTIAALVRECELVRQYGGIHALPGVELTHVPPSAIDFLAAKAKALGAKLVLVHGETPVEPVEAGTNEAAIRSSHVDIIAHPGLMDEQLFALAAERGVFVEVTARRGHCLANGYVAGQALRAGARLLVSSDAHSPGDLLSAERARFVALGAGVPEPMISEVLEANPRLLLERVGA